VSTPTWRVFRTWPTPSTSASSLVAARATLEAALERRETRGCHNRSDHPALDPSLQVNLVWSGPGRLARETIPPAPDDIAALMREVSTAGKYVE
jgi:succinate dehydrogenase / fumarate reductase, flavoprotein subunit